MTDVASAASPTIIGIAMVKNEQDIIEPFVRHNLKFLDYLMVLDNGSVDATREILLKLSRELDTVIVADDAGFEYTQSERMTRLLHGCQSAFFADYVVPLDADEFLGAADRATFEAVLGRIRPGGCGLVPWQTYVVTPSTAGRCGDDPPRSIEWRRRVEAPAYKKAILRADGQFDPTLVIDQGSHGVRSTSGRLVYRVDLKDLALLHFPVRSRNQLVAKSVVGWMAYVAKDSRARQSPQGYGYHWRINFDKVASESGIENRALCDASFSYAQTVQSIDWKRDVVRGEARFDYARTHSSGTSLGALALIARSWERSLTGPSAVSLVTGPRRASATSSADTSAAPVGATAFDAAWHWNNLFLDVPPFRYIAEKFRPATALDVGCGIGGYLNVLREYGASRSLGVDGLPPEATMLGEGEYLARDLSQPLRLGRTFDVVVCVEVAEHLDAGHEDTLLDSVADHANGLIVFSAAEPGQPGHGHVNCRPISHWLGTWRQRGWTPSLVDTLAMRSLASLSWFRRNLVVLRRENVATADRAIEILERIAARRFVWYGQAPGVRHVPFLEAAPPGAGYVDRDARQRSVG
jgi:SAM-dependent methyltransferase